MKLQNLLYSTLFLFVIAGFSSCGDDEEDSVPDLTTEITGNYIGFYTEGVGGWGMNISSVPTVITKLNNDEVDVQITPGTGLGSINFEATMTSDSTFGQTEIFELSDGQNATALGSLSDNFINITIAAEEDQNGLSLIVNYTGFK